MADRITCSKPGDFCPELEKIAINYSWLICKRLDKVLHRTGVKNLIIRGDEVKSENVSDGFPKLNSAVVLYGPESDWYDG